MQDSRRLGKGLRSSRRVGIEPGTCGGRAASAGALQSPVLHAVLQPPIQQDWSLKTLDWSIDAGLESRISGPCHSDCAAECWPLDASRHFFLERTTRDRQPVTSRVHDEGGGIRRDPIEEGTDAVHRHARPRGMVG